MGASEVVGFAGIGGEVIELPGADPGRGRNEHRFPVTLTNGAAGEQFPPDRFFRIVCGVAAPLEIWQQRAAAEQRDNASAILGFGVCSTVGATSITVVSASPIPPDEITDG